MDAILLAHGRTTDLADLAYAYASSAERMTEMREQGAAFGQVVASITGQTPPSLPYALALAHATRGMTLPVEDILALYLQALSAQLISAAVRFVPLKAADGQKVLAGLAQTITEPFTPEGGAYGTGRTMGHSHGPEPDAETFGWHDHGDGKLHFHAPKR